MNHDTTYEPPAITVVGSLSDITKGNVCINSDAGDFAANNNPNDADCPIEDFS